MTALKKVKKLYYIQHLIGNGSYIYIETSPPRKYDEKARLLSPWMKGPKRMTFFYSMYGGTIESLSVYARINGSDSRIWSRHGNLKTSNWTQGCVAISYYGIYQVKDHQVSNSKHYLIESQSTRLLHLSCFLEQTFFPPQCFCQSSCIVGTR